MKKIFFSLAFLTFGYGVIKGQESPDFGQISGNFQSDFQYYFKDTAIVDESTFPDEKLLGTGFLNLTYRRKNITMGVRYENYQNNRLGLPVGYKGEGITYRYFRYVNDKLDLTVGNFYDQFGVGLVFRAYEERGLGIDNNLDGIRIAYELADGVNVKGIIGRQRKYFEKAESILRGFDAEWNLKNSLKWENNTNLILGASILSKFEEARDPFYNFPENVAAGGFRANLITGNFNFYGEYARKTTDPNNLNNLIYKDGQALYTTASYARDNLGILIGAKYYDNMIFRSERNFGPLEALNVNYLPPLTELHTYALPALYSYGTQGNGETGLQAEVSYKFDRNTLLGGKYGTLLTVNFSNSYSLDKDYKLRPRYSPIDTTIIDSVFEGSQGYSAAFGKIGPYQYFQDLNIEVKKKLGKKWKGTFTYYNFIYNFTNQRKGVNDYFVEDPNMFYINAGVLELLYKIKPKHSLRSEFQVLLTDQQEDNFGGDWALVLLEYSIAPNWFFAVQDAYNFGNKNEHDQLHYYNVNVGYTRGTTKFQLGYGRQQEGVFCVGGICRVVPASNGFTLSVTSNF